MTKSLIKTTLPEGLVLTEDGYKVLRLNGDVATGFIGSDGRYYERLQNLDNDSEEWFTEFPALEEQ